MGPPRRTACGAGEHDLTDPANVGTARRSSGAVHRYCLPCNRRRKQEWRARQRKARGPAPQRRRGPRTKTLDALQAVADGAALPEAAEELGVTPRGVRDSLDRLRRHYGVRSTAAAVAAALARREIRPVRRTVQPLPQPGAAAEGHAQSLLLLIRGGRGPLRPGGRRHGQLLDDCYAFSEPHAVSVLWAAGFITAGDIRPLEKEAA